MNNSYGPTRLLHTMIRVSDLDRSIDFYTRILGMKLLRRKDYPDGKFTLAFLGYDDEDRASAIELTYNWETTSYEKGTAFGHLAVAVDDIYAYCDLLKQKNIEFSLEPGPMLYDPDEVIAFIHDPDGYMIELIARQ